MEINTGDYKYRIELHAHTRPASGCSEISPEDLIRTYKKLNCDAVCITNHFTASLFPPGSANKETVTAHFDDYLRAKTEGDRLGVNVIFGMELRFAENSNDYLIYGTDEEEALKISYLLGEGVAQFRAAYRNEKSVFLQAHPFRSGMADVLPELLDGIEVFNMHPHHNSRIGIAARYAKQHGFIAIAGTDYHHPTHEGLAITCAKTLPRDSYELAALIKSRDYIFDIGGFCVI